MWRMPRQIDGSLRWGHGPNWPPMCKAKWQGWERRGKLDTNVKLLAQPRVTTTKGVVQYENMQAVTINDNLILFIWYPLHI